MVYDKDIEKEIARLLYLAPDHEPEPSKYELWTGLGIPVLGGVSVFFALKLLHRMIGPWKTETCRRKTEKSEDSSNLSGVQYMVACMRQLCSMVINVLICPITVSVFVYHACAQISQRESLLPTIPALGTTPAAVSPKKKLAKKLAAKDDILKSHVSSRQLQKSISSLATQEKVSHLLQMDKASGQSQDRVSKVKDMRKEYLSKTRVVKQDPLYKPLTTKSRSEILQLKNPEGKSKLSATPKKAVGKLHAGYREVLISRQEAKATEGNIGDHSLRPVPNQLHLHVFSKICDQPEDPSKLCCKEVSISYPQKHEDCKVNKVDKNSKSPRETSDSGLFHLGNRLSGGQSLRNMRSIFSRSKVRQKRKHNASDSSSLSTRLPSNDRVADVHKSEAFYCHLSRDAAAHTRSYGNAEFSGQGGKHLAMSGTPDPDLCGKFRSKTVEPEIMPVDSTFKLTSAPGPMSPIISGTIFSCAQKRNKISTTKHSHKRTKGISAKGKVKKKSYQEMRHDHKAPKSEEKLIVPRDETVKRSDSLSEAHQVIASRAAAPVSEMTEQGLQLSRETAIMNCRGTLVLEAKSRTSIAKYSNPESSPKGILKYSIHTDGPAPRRSKPDAYTTPSVSDVFTANDLKCRYREHHKDEKTVSFRRQDGSLVSAAQPRISPKFSRPAKRLLMKQTDFELTQGQESIHMVESLLSCHGDSSTLAITDTSLSRSLVIKGNKKLSPERAMTSLADKDLHRHTKDKGQSSPVVTKREPSMLLSGTGKRAVMPPRELGIEEVRISPSLAREVESMPVNRQLIMKCKGRKPFAIDWNKVNRTLKSIAGQMKENQETDSSFPTTKRDNNIKTMNRRAKTTLSPSESPMSFEKFILESKNPIGNTLLLCKSGITRRYEELGSLEPQGPGSVRSIKRRPKSQLFPTLSSFLNHIECENRERHEHSAHERQSTGGENNMTTEEESFQNKREANHLGKIRECRIKPLVLKEKTKDKDLQHFEKNKSSGGSLLSMILDKVHQDERRNEQVQGSDKIPHFGVPDLNLYAEGDNQEENPKTEANFTQTILTSDPGGSWRKQNPSTVVKTFQGLFKATFQGAQECKQENVQDTKHKGARTLRKQKTIDVRRWQKDVLKNMKKDLKEKVAKRTRLGVPKPKKLLHEQTTEIKSEDTKSLKGSGKCQTSGKKSESLRSPPKPGVTSKSSPIQLENAESAEVHKISPRGSLGKASLTLTDVSLVKTEETMVAPTIHTVSEGKDSSSRAQRVSPIAPLRQPSVKEDWPRKERKPIEPRQITIPNKSKSPSKNVNKQMSKPPGDYCIQDHIEHISSLVCNSIDSDGTKLDRTTQLDKSKTIEQNEDFECHKVQLKDSFNQSPTRPETGPAEKHEIKDILVRTKSPHKLPPRSATRAPTDSRQNVTNLSSTGGVSNEPVDKPETQSHLTETPDSLKPGAFVSTDPKESGELRSLLERAKHAVNKPTSTKETNVQNTFGKSLDSCVAHLDSKQHEPKSRKNLDRFVSPSRIKPSSDTSMYLVHTIEHPANKSGVLGMKLKPQYKKIVSSEQRSVAGGDNSSKHRALAHMGSKADASQKGISSYTSKYRAKDTRGLKFTWRDTVAFRKRLQHLMQHNIYIKKKTEHLRSCGVIRSETGNTVISGNTFSESTVNKEISKCPCQIIPRVASHTQKLSGRLFGQGGIARSKAQTGLQLVERKDICKRKPLSKYAKRSCPAKRDTSSKNNEQNQFGHSDKSKATKDNSNITNDLPNTTLKMKEMSGVEDRPEETISLEHVLPKSWSLPSDTVAIKGPSSSNSSTACSDIRTTKSQRKQSKQSKQTLPLSSSPVKIKGFTVADFKNNVPVSPLTRHYSAPGALSKHPQIESSNTGSLLSLCRRNVPPRDTAVVQKSDYVMSGKILENRQMSTTCMTDKTIVDSMGTFQRTKLLSPLSLENEKTSPESPEFSAARKRRKTLSLIFEKSKPRGILSPPMKYSCEDFSWQSDYWPDGKKMHTSEQMPTQVSGAAHANLRVSKVESDLRMLLAKLNLHSAPGAKTILTPTEDPRADELALIKASQNSKVVKYKPWDIKLNEHGDTKSTVSKDQNLMQERPFPATTKSGHDESRLTQLHDNLRLASHTDKDTSLCRLSHLVKNTEGKDSTYELSGFYPNAHEPDVRTSSFSTITKQSSSPTPSYDKISCLPQSAMIDYRDHSSASLQKSDLRGAILDKAENKLLTATANPNADITAESKDMPRATSKKRMSVIADIPLEQTMHGRKEKEQDKVREHIANDNVMNDIKPPCRKPTQRVKITEKKAVSSKQHENDDKTQETVLRQSLHPAMSPVLFPRCPAYESGDHLSKDASSKLSHDDENTQTIAPDYCAAPMTPKRSCIDDVNLVVEGNKGTVWEVEPSVVHKPMSEKRGDKMEARTSSAPSVASCKEKGSKSSLKLLGRGHFVRGSSPMINVHESNGGQQFPDLKKVSELTSLKPVSQFIEAQEDPESSSQSGKSVRTEQGTKDRVTNMSESESVMREGTESQHMATSKSNNIRVDLPEKIRGEHVKPSCTSEYGTLEASSPTNANSIPSGWIEQHVTRKFPGMTTEALQDRKSRSASVKEIEPAKEVLDSLSLCNQEIADRDSDSARTTSSESSRLARLKKRVRCKSKVDADSTSTGMHSNSRTAAHNLEDKSLPEDKQDKRSARTVPSPVSDDNVDWVPPSTEHVSLKAEVLQNIKGNDAGIDSGATVDNSELSQTCSNQEALLTICVFKGDVSSVTKGSGEAPERLTRQQHGSKAELHEISVHESKAVSDGMKEKTVVMKCEKRSVHIISNTKNLEAAKNSKESNKVESSKTNCSFQDFAHAIKGNTNLHVDDQGAGDTQNVDALSFTRSYNNDSKSSVAEAAEEISTIGSSDCVSGQSSLCPSHDADLQIKDNIDVVINNVQGKVMTRSVPLEKTETTASVTLNKRSVVSTDNSLKVKSTPGTSKSQAHHGTFVAVVYTEKDLCSEKAKSTITVNSKSHDETLIGKEKLSPKEDDIVQNVILKNHEGGRVGSKETARVQMADPALTLSRSEFEKSCLCESQPILQTQGPERHSAEWTKGSELLSHTWSSECEAHAMRISTLCPKQALSTVSLPLSETNRRSFKEDSLSVKSTSKDPVSVADNSHIQETHSKSTTGKAVGEMSCPEAVLDELKTRLQIKVLGGAPLKRHLGALKRDSIIDIARGPQFTARQPSEPQDVPDNPKAQLIKTETIGKEIVSGPNRSEQKSKGHAKHCTNEESVQRDATENEYDEQPASDKGHKTVFAKEKRVTELSNPAATKRRVRQMASNLTTDGICSFVNDLHQGSDDMEKSSATRVEDLESILNSEIKKFQISGRSRRKRETKSLFTGPGTWLPRLAKRPRKTQHSTSPLSSQLELQYHYVRENNGSSICTSSNTSLQSIFSNCDGPPLLASKQKKPSSSGRFTKLEDFLQKTEGSFKHNDFNLPRQYSEGQSSFTSITHSSADDQRLQALLEMPRTNGKRAIGKEQKAGQNEKRTPTITNVTTMSSRSSCLSNLGSVQNNKKENQDSTSATGKRERNRKSFGDGTSVLKKGTEKPHTLWSENESTLKTCNKNKGKKEYNEKSHTFNSHTFNKATVPSIKTDSASYKNPELNHSEENENHIDLVVGQGSGTTKKKGEQDPKIALENSSLDHIQSSDDIIKDLSLDSSLKVSEMVIPQSSTEKLSAAQKREQLPSQAGKADGNILKPTEECSPISDSSSSIVLSWVGSDTLESPFISDRNFAEEIHTNVVDTSRVLKSNLHYAHINMAHWCEEPHIQTMCEDSPHKRQSSGFCKVWEGAKSRIRSLVSSPKKRRNLTDKDRDFGEALLNDNEERNSVSFTDRWQKSPDESGNDTHSRPPADTNYNKAQVRKDLFSPKPQPNERRQPSQRVNRFGVFDKCDGRDDRDDGQGGSPRCCCHTSDHTSGKPLRGFARFNNTLSGYSTECMLEQQSYFEAILRDPKWNPAIAVSDHRDNPEQHDQSGVAGNYVESALAYQNMKYESPVDFSSPKQCSQCILHHSSCVARQPKMSDWSSPFSTSTHDGHQVVILHGYENDDCTVNPYGLNENRYESSGPFEVASQERSAQYQEGQFCVGQNEKECTQCKKRQVDTRFDNSDAFAWQNNLALERNPMSTSETVNERHRGLPSLEEHLKATATAEARGFSSKPSLEQHLRAASDTGAQMARLSNSLEQHSSSRSETGNNGSGRSDAAQQASKHEGSVSTSSQASFNWYRPQSLPSPTPVSNSQTTVRHSEAGVSQTERSPNYRKFGDLAAHSANNQILASARSTALSRRAAGVAKDRQCQQILSLSSGEGCSHPHHTLPCKRTSSLHDKQPTGISSAGGTQKSLNVLDVRNTAALIPERGQIYGRSETRESAESCMSETPSRNESKGVKVYPVSTARATDSCQSPRPSARFLPDINVRERGNLETSRPNHEMGTPPNVPAKTSKTVSKIVEMFEKKREG